MESIGRHTAELTLIFAFLCRSASGLSIFNASEVYECLTSVPFHPAVASQFVQYYNDTLQFQSTLAFLKDPPQGYQQPPTDLMAGLARIQQAIDNGQFKDQYSFEATLQTLIYSAHDAHLQLFAGVLAPFTFGLPFELASVSLDGKELPKVYDTCNPRRSQSLIRWSADLD